MRVPLVICSYAMGSVQACSHHTIEPLDYLPFAFEARPSQGEVWVLPVLATHHPVHIAERHLLGQALPRPQRKIRDQRAAELAMLPSSIALALPGELNARLGAQWKGEFRHRPTANPLNRVADAVAHRRPDLHAVLEHYGAAFGEWALLTWVNGIACEPLIARALPGDVVVTPAGPVVVDLDDDPQLISVQLGTALLAPDGEVVLRYEDRFVTVLTGRAAKQDAARDIAGSLADEVAMVWMTEQRLAGTR